MLTIVRLVMKKKFLANFLTAFYKFFQNFAFNVVIERIQTSFIDSASLFKKKKTQMSHLVFRNMKPGVKKPGGGCNQWTIVVKKNDSKKIQTSSNSSKNTRKNTHVYLM